jgi:hypothetical protein
MRRCRVAVEPGGTALVLAFLLYRVLCALLRMLVRVGVDDRDQEIGVLGVLTPSADDPEPAGEATALPHRRPGPPRNGKPVLTARAVVPLSGLVPTRSTAGAGSP